MGRAGLGHTSIRAWPKIFFRTLGRARPKNILKFKARAQSGRPKDWARQVRPNPMSLPFLVYSAQTPHLLPFYPHAIFQSSSYLAIVSTSQRYHRRKRRRWRGRPRQRRGWRGWIRRHGNRWRHRAWVGGSWTRGGLVGCGSERGSGRSHATNRWVRRRRSSSESNRSWCCTSLPLPSYSGPRLAGLAAAPSARLESFESIPFVGK